MPARLSHSCGLSSVLNSEKAPEVNIIIIRTSVLIREFALTYKDLPQKISKLEKNITVTLKRYLSR